MFHRNAKKHRSQLASESGRRKSMNEPTSRKNTVDQDKANLDPGTGGLFQGRFDPSRSLLPRYDPSDGVMRCPYCNWEVENGFCNQCGLRFDVADSSDLGLDPDNLRDFTDVEHRSWGGRDDLSDVVSNSEDNSTQSSESSNFPGSRVFTRGIPSWGTSDGQVRAAAAIPSVNSRHRHRPRGGSSITPSEAMDTVEEAEDGDDGSSLEDFIVNDDSDDPPNLSSSISRLDSNSSELDSSERDVSAEPPARMIQLREETSSDDDDDGRVVRGPGDRRRRLQQRNPSRTLHPEPASGRTGNGGLSHRPRDVGRSRRSELTASSTAARENSRLADGTVQSNASTQARGTPAAARSVATSDRRSDRGIYHAGLDGIDESSSSHGYARFYEAPSEFGNPAGYLGTSSDGTRSRAGASLAVERQIATTSSLNAPRRRSDRRGKRGAHAISSISKQQDGDWEDEEADSDGTEKAGPTESGSILSEETTPSVANERMQNVLSYLDAQPEDVRTKASRGKEGERRRTGYDRKISMVFAENLGLSSTADRTGELLSGESKLGGASRAQVSQTIQPSAMPESPPRPSAPLPDSAKNRNRMTLNSLAADALSSEENRRHPTGSVERGTIQPADDALPNAVRSNAGQDNDSRRHRARGPATISSNTSSNVCSRVDGVSTSFSTSTKLSSMGTIEKEAPGRMASAPINPAVRSGANHPSAAASKAYSNQPRPYTKEMVGSRDSSVPVGDHSVTQTQVSQRQSGSGSGPGLGPASSTLSSNNPYHRLQQARRQASRPVLRSKRSKTSLRPRSPQRSSHGTARSDNPQPTSPGPTSRSNATVTVTTAAGQTGSHRSKSEKTGGGARSPSRSGHASGGSGAGGRRQSSGARQTA